MPNTGIGESQASGELALDPFAFHVGAASRIAGLGGTEASHSPDYVFHTPYVEVARGSARFTLRFAGLQAKTGTLVLRIHMLSLEPGARACLANSERITLNRLIQLGGEFSIGFEGFRDVSFALVGLIHSDTDAIAEALTVTLDRPADPAARPEFAAEAKRAAYGYTLLQPAASLLSTERPTLTDPVTQLATAAQLRESAAGAWLAHLHPQRTSSVEHWRKVFTLQALRRYGMLGHGARGIGFEPVPCDMPMGVAAMRANVVAALPTPTDPKFDTEASKFDVGPQMDSAMFSEKITVRVVQWDNLPGDFVNFDFVWTANADEQFHSVAVTVGFVENVMECLRPGGLAVHTMNYNLSPSGSTVPSTERILLQQGDVERIALVLVSRGHEVAQFKISAVDPILAPASHSVAAQTMVGIIARKVRLPD